MNSLQVTDVKVTKNLLQIHFKCNGLMRKFFSTNQFFAEYNRSIEGTPEALLVIPFLATASPVAWAINGKVYVQTVDKVFVESLNKIKTVFQGMYPQMRFGGELHSNTFAKPQAYKVSRSMALFSGGADSIATYIRHRKENPIITSIHGADIDLSNTKAWETAIEPVVAFSKKTNSELRVIRSNFKSILDKLMLSSFSTKIGGDWWTRIMHGLALLGLCAPLTFVDNIGKLYIAASFTKEWTKPWASLPEIDNNVKWNNVTVTHDGYELSRQQKLKIIAEYIKETKQTLHIRSCLDPRKGKNCNECEKCCRTIVGLEITGTDPSLLGFKVDNETFSSIKTKLLNGEWTFGDDEKYMWGDIKKHSCERSPLTNAQAESLISWLLAIDLNAIKSKKKRSSVSILWKIIVPILRAMPYEAYILPRTAYKSLDRPLQKLIFH